MLGQQMTLNFAGASYPQFELPPQTQNFGKDMKRDAVLRVRWDRLSFYSAHKYLGPIRLRIDTQKSGGRVQSVAGQQVSGDKVWMAEQPAFKEDGYFPAANENRLFFELELPRWGLRYKNVDPVINGALLDRIPPDNIEYEMQNPVKFKPDLPLAPSITLEACRMAMALLERVEAKVVSFKVKGAKTTVIFEISLDAPVEDAEIAIIGDTTSNVGFAPVEQFLKVGREPARCQVTFDLTNALWPGTASVCFVLIHPYESKGASILTFDLEELRTGQLIDGLPSFGDEGLVDGSSSDLPHKSISQGPLTGS